MYYLGDRVGMGMQYFTSINSTRFFIICVDYKISDKLSFDPYVVV